ncbi:MAG: GNAT family N-acetyltransferase [Nitrososphaerales archaeon]
MNQAETSQKSLAIQEIINSQTSYFVTLCANFPSSYHRERLLNWFVTGVKFPMFNGIHLTKIEADIPLTVKQVLEPFKSRKVPMFWWIDPLTVPQDLGWYLEEEGLRQTEGDIGMRIELSMLENKGQESVENLRIERVEDENTMREWMKVASGVFSIPTNELDASLKLFNHGLDENAKFQHYIGLIDKIPVATSSILYDSKNLVGIYDVSTIPKKRGRGIGRVMTIAPLLRAREKGYKVAVLQASTIGRGVYASIGFKEYCKLNSYYMDYSK